MFCYVVLQSLFFFVIQTVGEYLYVLPHCSPSRRISENRVCFPVGERERERERREEREERGGERRGKGGGVFL